MTLRFEKSYTIEADLDFVWECIADEDTCGLWQGDDCVIGTNINDPVELFGGSVVGKILEWNEEKLLKYTWRGSDWDNAWKDLIVEYRFTEMDGKVMVKVIHDNFPNEKERDSHALGWDSYFFEPMTEFIQQSK